MMGENMTPKFSILIVTLNAASEIQKTIQSVKDQTYSNYEVVVKDGESKDGTLSYVPQDVHYKVCSKKDKSVYDGMNQAISMAKGDYIIFLNAGDTFYDENVLKNVADYIENNHIKNESSTNDRRKVTAK